MIARRLLLGTLAWAMALAAQGHAISSNYLIVEDHDTGRISAIWDLAAADLHWALGLDSNRDGRIVWSEVQSRRDAIETLATAHLIIRRGVARCPVRLTDLLLTQHAGDPYVSLQLDVPCSDHGTLGISSTIFGNEDASQRTLLEAVTPAGHFNSLLSPSGDLWRAPAQSSWFATLTEFVGQGMWHVWVGYDHIAFLLLLLLPSVLQRTARGWRAAVSGRRAVHDLLIIVTAFTLAHSITLALAATGLVRPQVGLIEASIAFSIIAAGMLNLFPAAARWRLALAFGFGLMHGFGFANALAELGASGFRLVPALAGFNIGVELAQLSVVLLVFPVLLRARSSAFYAIRLMPAASMVIAMAGAVWLSQRL